MCTVVMLCFAFIISTLEFMEVIRRYFSNSINISWGTILELTAYHTVISIFSFFPFVVFLASILFYATMHWKLELTAMKIMGATTIDILKSLMIGTFALGAFYITVLDLFSAHSTNMILSVNGRIRSEFRKPDVAITNRGVWLRDVHDGKSYIVNASSFDEVRNEFSNIRLFEFNEKNELIQSIYAKVASISAGQWTIKKAVIAMVDGTEKALNQMTIPTTITPSTIGKMAANPAGISFWSMMKYIDVLERAGLSSARYKTDWFLRLSSILQMFAFVTLVTAACVNYNARDSRRYSLKVAALLASAFPIYFFNNVVVALGTRGHMHNHITTCVIPLLTISVGISILAKR
jgi:lipopolysaccharide export LptBFGC system permease protein LptF